ncbi:hypothetical protein KBY93_04130 [Synechococcus sp. J7-Johnson]|uniref:hypothetical protein n=1 Tax=Synechococcus sp. J7-Johnson TaxID=2823737 RepID=UPI0020CD3666|nr:hypothetical protein [Synechococcus sp. J7-Johnson]MCP9839823.1 hypothetical protein [Synechococcus sp. J7-Johnson]
MTLHQGDCVHLSADMALSAGPTSDGLYQVIGVDAPHDRCWVRRWPLARHGSPVFEVSIRQVELNHLPHSQSCPSRS